MARDWGVGMTDKRDRFLDRMDDDRRRFVERINETDANQDFPVPGAPRLSRPEKPAAPTLRDMIESVEASVSPSVEARVELVMAMAQQALAEATRLAGMVAFLELRIKDKDAPNEFADNLMGGGGSDSVEYTWSFQCHINSDGNLTSSGASIGPGWVICGVRQPQQVSGQCVVSGGTRSSPTYAVLEYNYASGTATILGTTTAQYPVSEPGIFRCALHAFALESGHPVHVQVHQAGDILVPGFA